MEGTVVMTPAGVIGVQIGKLMWRRQETGVIRYDKWASPNKCISVYSSQL